MQRLMLSIEPSEENKSVASCSYQQSIDEIIVESTTSVVENQPAPILTIALMRAKTNQDASELSTLDGPSGLLIGEMTHMVESDLNTLTVNTHASRTKYKNTSCYSNRSNLNFNR